MVENGVWEAYGDVWLATMVEYPAFMPIGVSGPKKYFVEFIEKIYLEDGADAATIAIHKSSKKASKTANSKIFLFC